MADPGCLSRIPDPDFYPSQIPDPKTATKTMGEKKFFVKPFFCSHKFHKTEYYFIFDMVKKKIWPNFPKIIKVFTQKLSPSPQKYGFGIRDLGSEIRDPRSWIRNPEKTYSGSRIQGSKRHRILDPGSGSATLRVSVRFFKISKGFQRT